MSGQWWWNGNQWVWVTPPPTDSALGPVLALVLGGLSVFVCWVPLVGLGVGGLACIFAAFGLNNTRGEHRLASWIGMVLGFVSACISAVVYGVLVNH